LQCKREREEGLAAAAAAVSGGGGDLMPGIEQQEAEAPPPPPPRQWPPVATEALRDRIVEKVKENRVTLIVGDTGCGNDSGSSSFDAHSSPPRSVAFGWFDYFFGGIWGLGEV
jgi:hypothetical protein